MNEKFYRLDNDFYAVIDNEDGTFNIGEFTDSSADPYWVYDFKIKDIETAKSVSKVLVEVFKDGWDKYNYR